jgi:hypothetical protein
MKWTKERKVFALLLAGGLAALGVDRLTRAAPDAPEDPAAFAVAKPDNAPAPPIAKPAQGTIAQNLAPAQPASFTQRLRRAATTSPTNRSSDSSATADIFRPSRVWAPEPVVAAPPPPPPPPTTRPTPKPPDELAQFRAKHRLTAVLVATRHAPSRAIIDGNPLRIGQIVDHFRLVEVSNDRATFQSRSGGQITLALEDEPASSKAVANTDR